MLIKISMQFSIKGFWSHYTPNKDSWMGTWFTHVQHIQELLALYCTSSKALPESVGFEGRVGVDVVMQPPLHRHVPVTHAVSHLHAEVSVVAVNVLDGFKVIFLLNCRIRADHERKNKSEWKIKTKRDKRQKYDHHTGKDVFLRVPIVDSGPSARFAKSLFWIAA